MTVKHLGIIARLSPPLVIMDIRARYFIERFVLFESVRNAFVRDVNAVSVAVRCPELVF